jgi:hypothetical protein
LQDAIGGIWKLGWWRSKGKGRHALSASGPGGRATWGVFRRDSGGVGAAGGEGDVGQSE